MSDPYLLTGASGFAGRHLLAVREMDEPVLALLRDPAAWSREDWTSDLKNVDIVRGGVSGAQDWTAGLPKLAGIFHFAALVRHSRRNADEVYATNVEGTLNMVRLAAAHGCRMVMLSTSGVVGCFASPDESADETAPFCEERVSSWPYYDSKIVAERRARLLADELGVELVFLRPPVLLGPGDHRFRSTSNILRMLRGKLPALIDGGMHFIDVRDAMPATWRAMRIPSARPVYHLAGCSTSIRGFFDMVEQVSGVRAPRLVLPQRLAHWIASLDEWLGVRLRGEALHYFVDPVVVEMAACYWGLHSLYARDDLAYASRDPLETLQDTVDWLRENHPAFR